MNQRLHHACTLSRCGHKRASSLRLRALIAARGSAAPRFTRCTAFDLLRANRLFGEETLKRAGIGCAALRCRTFGFALV
jgi:hypothetical protein